jgi:hypothetical protein
MYRRLLEMDWGERQPGDQIEIYRTIESRFSLGVNLFLAEVFDICLQAALLAIGLLSLAYQTNYVPPLWAVAGGVLGVMILGVHAFLLPLVTAYRFEYLLKKNREYVTAFKRAKRHRRRTESQPQGGSSKSEPDPG